MQASIPFGLRRSCTLPVRNTRSSQPTQNWRSKHGRPCAR